MVAETLSSTDLTFENNVKALNARYPDLHQKIMRLDRRLPPNIVKTGVSEAWMNILLADQSRQALYYDSDDPIGYSRRYISSLDLRYAPFMVFLGFGLGYQVVSALRDFSKSLHIQHIIIIEKDLRLFGAALRILDLSQLIMHPDIKLFIGFETQDLFVVLRNYFAENKNALEFSRNLKFVTMPAAHLFEEAYYKAAHQMLKSVLTHVFGHIGNDPYDSLLGLSNTLSNLLPIIEDPGIVAFKDRFKKRPAIVIGAGPSLNKNINLLKEARHKALLVAVDAAMKPLLEAGIKPHIVTNIERTKGQDIFFRNLGPQEDTFFVFSAVVPSETYQAFKGPKIIGHRYLDLMNWLGIPKGALSGGPLVGNFAFSIARYLGCGPIVLVGQDLSFKPTGATHVRGMVFGNISKYKKNAVDVEGNYHETLRTTRSFAQGIKSFEAQIESFEGVCINATEGGAKIRGAHFMSLGNALRNFCKRTFDPLEDLKEIWSAEKAKQKRPHTELVRISALINDCLLELDSAVSECQDCIRSMDSVLKVDDLLPEGRPDPELLKTIRVMTSDLNQIREKVIALPAFATFEMVIQSVHFDIEMRKNFARDRYYHPEFAELESFFLLKEWFVKVGQLILSTRFAIEKESKRILVDEAAGV